MMRRLAAPAALLLALLATLVPGSAQTPAGDLWTRMLRVNADLRSYRADLHVDVHGQGVLALVPALDGVVYYERPDRSAVVFTSIPLMANAFRKVYPQLEPPTEWKDIYDVTRVSDDGTTARFRLVRKETGRIDHVDVAVDDATATVVAMAYHYKDGGSIAFRQTYALIDGNYVVVAQTGTVDMPPYSAELATTLSNYRLNLKIDESVFGTD